MSAVERLRALARRMKVQRLRFIEREDARVRAAETLIAGRGPTIYDLHFAADAERPRETYAVFCVAGTDRNVCRAERLRGISSTRGLLLTSEGLYEFGAREKAAPIPLLQRTALARAALSLPD